MFKTKNFLLLAGLVVLTAGSYTLATGETQSAIVIDPVTKKIYVTTGYFQNTGSGTVARSGAISADSNSGAQTTSTTTQTQTETTVPAEEVLTTSTPTQEETTTTTQTQTEVTVADIVEPIIDDGLPEYEQALAWMYANGLTKYDDPDEYRPDDYLTREESAKIIGQLYATLGYDQTVTNITACEFLDQADFDPSLADHIKKVCSRGLFKGYEGNYMPTQALTKPQTMAVLMRMFEGKMSNEAKTPRWGDYYLKGQAIGIIINGDINSYDRPITRKEVALYVFRLKSIVVNAKLKTMSLNAMAQVDQEQNTETEQEAIENPEIIKENINNLANNIDASDDPELQEAVQWMYENGLTMHDTVAAYNPFDTLSREGAAKIMHVFAELFNLAGTYDGYIANECEFTDIDHLDDTMKDHVTNVCKMGLLKGSNNKFMPGDNITKAQYVVALVRMLEGEHLDETQSPRWKLYYEKALELGVVSPADAITFEGPITRYEVALFLYRFKVKYQMLKNLNSAKLQNEIISTVEGSVGTGTDGLYEANVYVDTNLIKDADFEIGYVETFGNRYKVVKSDVEKYDIPESFVRYGDLFDLVENEKVGTISFIVSNGIMIEGTMRFAAAGKRYVIQSLPDTKAHYKIKELAN